MNNTIVFLCCYYASSHDANGICSKNLVEEFIKRGDRVIVISLEDITDTWPTTVNNVIIYRIRGHRYLRLINKIKRNCNIFSRCLLILIKVIRSVLVFALYPNVSPWSSYLIFKKLKEIDKHNSIDAIIATYKPYPTIGAALKYKQTIRRETNLIIYHFDLMTVNLSGNKIGFIKSKLCKQAFKRELLVSDMILLPESAPKIDNPKIHYVDFPLYIKKTSTIKSSFEFPDQYVNIAFVGTLSTLNRNPSVAIKTIEKISYILGKELRIHIWGIVEDRKCLEVINQSTITVYHGVIENDQVISIMSRCDFLLNISNDITFQMIPSKIFQYFSVAKPIINFVKSPRDASLPYFRKYGHSIIIEEYNYELDLTIVNLVNFIEEYIGKKIHVSDSIFEKSTPMYICNLIDTLKKN